MTYYSSSNWRDYEKAKEKTWFELAQEMDVVPRSLKDHIASKPCVKLDEAQLEIAAENWVCDAFKDVKKQQGELNSWLEASGLAWCGPKLAKGYEGTLQDIKDIRKELEQTKETLSSISLGLSAGFLVFIIALAYNLFFGG